MDEQNKNDVQKKKIVYVDDVNYSLLAVKTRLQQRYTVYPAQSAERLFEILENLDPDLILLDINMPDVDGFQIIQQLKADARFLEIPVIFLTGKRDKKTIIKAMSLGAVDLVTKPFSDAELIKHIENQLNPDAVDDLKPIVLAVDDNPSILKSLNTLLHQQYRVYTLPKPEMLKVLLEKISPDLFLLDCKMPVLSGFDLVPIIRESTGHEKTPILFLTSEGTIDNLNAAVYFGASDFIVKPVDEVILREKLALHTVDYLIRRHLKRL